MRSFSKAFIAMGCLGFSLGVWAGANKEDAKACYNPSADLVGLVQDGIIASSVTKFALHDVPKTKETLERIQMHQRILDAQKKLMKDYQAGLPSMVSSPEQVRRSIARNSAEINNLRISLLKSAPKYLALSAGFGLVIWDGCGRIYRWSLESNEPKPISEKAASALLSMLEKNEKKTHGLDTDALKKAELRDLLKKQRSEFLRNEEIKVAHSTEQKDSSAFPIPHSYLDTRAP